MKIFNNIIASWKHIPYTVKHIYWVNYVARKCFNTVYPFHDWDKLLMYIFVPFLGTKKIHSIHRNWALHHKIFKDNSWFYEPSIMGSEWRKNVVYCEIVCDWESAHYSKPDKPLRARDTLRKFHPELEGEFEYLIKETEEILEK